MGGLLLANRLGLQIARALVMNADFALRRRVAMERRIRAVFSARSTYRPNQNTRSATLLGTAATSRLRGTG